jgi:hypothetical protein
MDYPAFTADGLLCEFEHGMRAMKSALRLARGAGIKDLDIGGLRRAPGGVSARSESVPKGDSHSAGAVFLLAPTAHSRASLAAIKITS